MIGWACKPPRKRSRGGVTLSRGQGRLAKAYPRACGAPAQANPPDVGFRGLFERSSDRRMTYTHGRHQDYAVVKLEEVPQDYAVVKEEVPPQDYAFPTCGGSQSIKMGNSDALPAAGVPDRCLKSGPAREWVCPNASNHRF